MLNSAAYRAALKQQLAAGARSFAAARQAAVQAVGADPAMAALLSQPNNNLAVEYCRAILEQRAGMTPVPLPRRGANHGQTLEESGHAQFASASALRALWAESDTLLLDEPFTGMDPAVMKKAAAMLKARCGAKPTLLATHDQEAIRELGWKVIELG